MIDEVLAVWKAFLSSHDPNQLAALLDDAVVFYSPVVYTPQVGKEITMRYLLAAGQALPGAPAPSSSNGVAGSDSDGTFRYTKEVASGDTAVLEFETSIDGKYVNGVDIIRANAEGRIVEFRVMIRPLQGVNAVHAQMAQMLERLQAASTD